MHGHEDIARRIEVAAGAGYRVLRNRRAPERGRGPDRVRRFSGAGYRWRDAEPCGAPKRGCDSPFSRRLHFTARRTPPLPPNRTEKLRAPPIPA